MSKPGKSVAKGRAIAARPLACLLAVALLSLALLAPVASAAPPEAPRLIGTDPPSPSTETLPRIMGKAEEGIGISGVGFSTATLQPVARATKHPEYLITVYAEDKSCEDSAAIVATGTAQELEEGGIQVSEPVRLDWETNFYAKQVNPQTSETSSCSNGIGYRQVTSRPSPPQFTTSSPVSPADGNSPRLIGTAPAGSTVSIYTDPSCAGAAVGSGSAASFENGGIQVTVADNTTTVFYAEATLAGLSSGCSTSSLEYREVTPEGQPGGGEGSSGGGGGDEKGPHEHLPNPPGKPAPPKLRTTPEGISNDNTPTVTGKAPGAARVRVFEGAGCRGEAVATGSPAQLSEGLLLHVADNSTVDLYGVSIDGGGDHSACSADPVVYVEDSLPPHTRFTSGPGGRTHRRTVQFSFADTTADPSTTFLCRLDRRRWSACQSPLRLRHLGHRRHTLTVRGIDAAGNVEKGGARRSFRVVSAH